MSRERNGRFTHRGQDPDLAAQDLLYDLFESPYVRERENIVLGEDEDPFILGIDWESPQVSGVSRQGEGTSHRSDLTVGEHRSRLLAGALTAADQDVGYPASARMTRSDSSRNRRTRFARKSAVTASAVGGTA